MVLFRRIEKIVNVDNKFAHIIVNLKVDNKIVENISREIDKENYSQNCFCIEYDYDYSKDRLYNVDSIEYYYIDIARQKHYFSCNYLELKLIEKLTLINVKKILRNKNKYSNVEFDMI